MTAPTLRRGALYRSSQNPLMAFLAVKVGPRAVTLESRNLDGSYPRGGAVRHVITRARANAILYPAPRDMPPAETAADYLRSLCDEAENMQLDALHPLAVMATNARAFLAGAFHHRCAICDEPTATINTVGSRETARDLGVEIGDEVCDDCLNEALAALLDEIASVGDRLSHGSPMRNDCESWCATIRAATAGIDAPEERTP